MQRHRLYRRIVLPSESCVARLLPCLMERPRSERGDLVTNGADNEIMSTRILTGGVADLRTVLGSFVWEDVIGARADYGEAGQKTGFVVCGRRS